MIQVTEKKEAIFALKLKDLKEDLVEVKKLLDSLSIKNFTHDQGVKIPRYWLMYKPHKDSRLHNRVRLDEECWIVVKFVTRDLGLGHPIDVQAEISVYTEKAFNLKFDTLPPISPDKPVN